jgi:hypothetical protein
VREALRLIAPLAGAGLFAALGGGAVAILDALTFAASALCLAALHVRETPPAPEERFLTEVAAGRVTSCTRWRCWSSASARR